MIARMSRRHFVWAVGISTLLVFVAVVAARPQLASVANGQAQACLADRDYQRSLFWLRLSSQIQSENPQTETLLALAWRKQNRLDEARQHLARARSLGGDTGRQEVLLDAQSGNLQVAMPHLEELLRVHSGELPDVCESYAIGLIQARSHIDVAYQILSMWAAEYPRDPQPHFLLAKLCLEFQDLNRGIQELDRALEIDPAHPGAANFLGEFRLSRQQPLDALPLFQIAERGQAERDAALVGQAHCLTLLGRPADARKIISRLLTERPDDPQANLVMAILESEAGKHVAAIRRLELLKSSEPNNPEVLQEMAKTLRATGQADQAAQKSERAAAMRIQLSLARHFIRQLLLKPDNPHLRNQIGQIYMGLGDEERGISWLKSALYLDPEFAPTLIALVQHYQDKSDPTGASKELADEYRGRLQNSF